MASPESSNSRSNYWRDYSKRRYEKNADRISLQAAIRYYKKKKEQGLDWIPRPRSKLYIYCQQYGLNIEAIVEGTQQLVEV